MAKYCANCGTEIKEGDNKCSKCGRTVGVPQKETNGMAIAGMICAFLIPLLIFSIVGLSKSKKINDGKELSIVGIVLSSLFLLIRIITIGLFLAFAAFAVANEDKISGAIEDAGSKIPGIIERFDNYENFEDNENFD